MRITTWSHSLPACVWHLGFRMGWRYWRLIGRARHNPNLVPQWIVRCRWDAESQQRLGNHDMAFALRSFADDLEFYRNN